MYEKVIIAGVEFRPKRSGGASSSSGEIVVYAYTADGKQRQWSYFISNVEPAVDREYAKPNPYAAKNQVVGSLGLLVGAAGIGDTDYNELFLSVMEGNIDRAMTAERRLESRAMQMARMAGRATIDGDENTIAADLEQLVVGRVVRADLYRDGNFTRLAPHPLCVLPSKDNGKPTFGGKTWAQWVEHHQRLRGIKLVRAEEVSMAEQLALLESLTPTKAEAEDVGL